MIPTLPPLLSYIDKHKLFQRVNLAWHEWFSLKLEEIIGHSTEVIPTLGLRTEISVGTERATQEYIYTNVIEIILDGVTRHVRVSCISDLAGGVTCSLEDISTTYNFYLQNSMLFASSLEIEKNIYAFTRSAIYAIADYCIFNFQSNPVDSIHYVSIESSDNATLTSQSTLRSWFADLQSTSQSTPILNRELTHSEMKEIFPLLNIHPEKFPFTSMIYIPIHIREQRNGYILFLREKSSAVFTPQDFNSLQTLGNTISLSIELSLLFNETKKTIRMRDEFMSAASHELKTPLTSLSLYTYLLEKAVLKKEQKSTEEHVKKIKDQIKKLTQLVNNLLNISRIELDRLPLHQEVFKLQDLVKEVVSSIHPEMYTLIVNTENLPAIFADKERIGQIIINLITNAIKYSPNFSTIEVHLYQENLGKVTLSVKDSGIGIEQHHQEKIFERFYQIQDQSEGTTFPGLGVGLYISREIAKRHGGEIHVHSEKGKGSTFFLTLPLSV